MEEINQSINVRFSTIGMIICSMLLMIGHVLVCCAYIRGFINSRY